MKTLLTLTSLLTLSASADVILQSASRSVWSEGYFDRNGDPQGLHDWDDKTTPPGFNSFAGGAGGGVSFEAGPLEYCCTGLGTSTQQSSSISGNTIAFSSSVNGGYFFASMADFMYRADSSIDVDITVTTPQTFDFQVSYLTDSYSPFGGVYLSNGFGYDLGLSETTSISGILPPGDYHLSGQIILNHAGYTEGHHESLSENASLSFSLTFSDVAQDQPRGTVGAVPDQTPTGMLAGLLAMGILARRITPRR